MDLIYIYHWRTKPYCCRNIATQLCHIHAQLKIIVNSCPTKRVCKKCFHVKSAVMIFVSARSARYYAIELWVGALNTQVE
jgi:hypothetical protein